MWAFLVLCVFQGKLHPGPLPKSRVRIDRLEQQAWDELRRQFVEGQLARIELQIGVSVRCRAIMISRAKLLQRLSRWEAIQSYRARFHARPV